MKVHLDFETRGPVDILAGTAKYTSECIPVLLGYMGEGIVLNVVEGAQLGVACDFIAPAEWADLHAFNAPFERGAFRSMGWDLPARRFHCTMAHAYSRAFKGSLAAVGEQIGLSDDLLKQPGGTQLINWFCKPPYRDPADHPEKWAKFKNYCLQDVRAECAISDWLSRYPVTAEERETWLWNEEVNDRGLPIDVNLVDSAIELSETILEDLKTEIERITGVDNGSSVAQLTAWLDPVVPNLQKATVESALLRDDLQPDVRRVLELRQQSARSSVTKYQALRRAEIDGRVHGTLQFCAAGRTGRFGGRIFQPQNLPRPTIARPDVAADMLADGQWGLFLSCYDDPMEALASCIRGAVLAPSGKALVSMDFSSIESRVLGWLSGCRWINETFRADKDTYKAFAESWLGVPYAEVDKATRTLCKPPTLGCGFRLGAKGLVRYAEQYRVDMSSEQAESAVAAFRAHCPEVVDLWYGLEHAASSTVDTGRRTEAFGLTLDIEGEFLRIHLPSGRALYYLRPELRMTKMPWGESKLSLTYMGVNQYTTRWERLASHGGKLTENVVQAIARDLLVEAGKRLEDVILHVHDELVCEVDEAHAREYAGHMQRILSDPPGWAPDLILKAEGKVSRRYGK